MTAIAGDSCHSAPTPRGVLLPVRTGSGLWPPQASDGATMGGICGLPRRGEGMHGR
ncbi:hypothetical protein SLNWT_5603 [Streptomyces albus]|uniref:Uncharacterized protein n=1 Tax=Streptomyces albus (strain ATCC 21838 / DSM 41398 / FERM P-419 / JCM 4703 / NBRC 107858) TaxID=1081613 RepID=A0A0B5EW11_STRA4|nr:hypothetical protein SLNWT_5603 [Streptomyces albus]AOU80281.1 hypothetical protein SLNHY_5590 [Streptomyces albus]